MPLLRRQHRHTQEEVEDLLDQGIDHLEKATSELKEYAEHVKRDREERERAEREAKERANGIGYGTD